MTSRDFCYWLQGYFELMKPLQVDGKLPLTAGQVDLIARHLAMVFAHEIDPQAGPPEHQKKLDHLHGNPPGDVKYRC